MLKPLETEYKGHQVTLECTYKKTWPPPQMYGHTPEDIDVMWKQGTVDANLHQQLATWKDKCGLMVMGPRCLDCPLAKIQNPRPGRPEVYTTEPWLPRKERLYWEDMKAAKEAQQEEEASQEDPARHAPPSKKEIADKMVDAGILESEPADPPNTKPDKKPLEAQGDESPEDEGDETLVDEDLGEDIASELAKVSEEKGDVDDDVIDALAED